MKLVYSSLFLLAASFLGGQEPRAKAAKTPGLSVSVLRVSNQRPGVVVRFENHSTKPLRLLRPLDGSEWGLIMPAYELTIADSTGKKIPMGRRECPLCGLYADLKWPDDYQIQILPGDAYEMTVGIGRQIPGTGIYSVSFSYRYDRPDRTPQQEQGIKYPDDLWIGLAASEPKQLEFTARP